MRKREEDTDLEDIPLLDEWRHQQVDVVWLVEVVVSSKTVS